MFSGPELVTRVQLAAICQTLRTVRWLCEQLPQTKLDSIRVVPLVQQPRTAGRQAARQRLQRILTGDSSPFAPMDVKVRPHTVFSFGRVSHGGLLETLFLVSGVCSFSICFLTRTLQRWIRP